MKLPILSLVLSGLVLTAWTAKAEHPDVLMIAVDDLRPMLGCYGDQRIKTPNIDRLAEKSVLFERAYCQFAKCGASRLSLMTGLRPAAIQVFGHGTKDVAAFRQRRPDATSLARWFKDQGYETRSFGKIDHDGWQIRDDWSVEPIPGREREMWEIQDEENPDGPTIIADRWACPVSQHPEVADEHFFAGRITAEAIEAYENAAEEQDLFLAIGYRRPHLPFIAPKRYHDLYTPDDSWLSKVSQPSAMSPPIAWVNSDGYLKAALRLGVDVPDRPARSDWQSWNGFEMRSYLGVPVQGEIDRKLQLELMHSYAACVSYVDAQVGKLLEFIELENTIVVFWSDHGWHLGEHSAWGKMTNFEIATRVPLLIAAPGVMPGRTRSLAELVDLYPTLCELAGLPVPSHLEGESLVPVLRHPNAPSASVALSEYPRFRNEFYGRALRTDRYRFVQWRRTKSGEVVKRELYDHDSDPDERTNLADHPNLTATLTQLESQLETAFQLP